MDEKAARPKYRKLTDRELKETLVGNNIRRLFPRSYGNDGIIIYPEGYALVLIEGSFSARYTINDSQLCLITFDTTPKCSYFLTNGRRLFEVSSENSTAVSVVDICPIEQASPPRGKCNVDLPKVIPPSS